MQHRICLKVTVSCLSHVNRSWYIVYIQCGCVIRPNETKNGSDNSHSADAGHERCQWCCWYAIIRLDCMNAKAVCIISSIQSMHIKEMTLHKHPKNCRLFRIGDIFLNELWRMFINSTLHCTKYYNDGQDSWSAYDIPLQTKKESNQTFQVPTLCIHLHVSPPDLLQSAFHWFSVSPSFHQLPIVSKNLTNTNNLSSLSPSFNINPPTIHNPTHFPQN